MFLFKVTFLLCSVGKFTFCEPVFPVKPLQRKLGRHLLIVAETSTHAKLARARFHALPDHEAVPRLEDVKRTVDRGERQSADKHRDFMLLVKPHFCQLVDLFFMYLLPLCIFFFEVGGDDLLEGFRGG